MTDFISGKLGARGVASGAARQPSQLTIAIEDESSAGRFVPTRPLVFSEAARAVFTAGRALWRYHHTQLGARPNASCYDIRGYFRGHNAKGRINAASGDAHHTGLLTSLRNAMGRPPRRANTFTLRLPGRAVWGKGKVRSAVARPIRHFLKKCAWYGLPSAHRRLGGGIYG